MARTNTSVYGIFRDPATAQDCVDALRAKGFRSTDISVLYPENEGTKDFAHQKSTKAPEGAVAGGSSGALIGAGLGWLVGAGTLFVPGLEHFAAAGPIVATMSGLGAGISLGGLLGALAGATVPEYEAKRFEGRIRRGGILLSVHCDNSEWTKMALNVVRASGGSDISTAHEARADFARSVKPMPRSRVSPQH